jgi:mRNA interferase RelE/StbE
LPYRITFKKSVSRDLRKLGNSEAGRVLGALASQLPEAADACPELKGKFAGLRKFRVGDYRVIFAIIGDSVLVTRVGHRRDVYRG